jgi:hypothetical protein
MTASSLTAIGEILAFVKFFTFAPKFGNFMANGVHGRTQIIWYEGTTRSVNEGLLARTLQKGN